MLRKLKHLVCILALIELTGLLTGCAETPPQRQQLAQVRQIVVVYLENRSFDHLYGFFPGAEGLKQAIAARQGTVQVDKSGNAYQTLPRVPDERNRSNPDARFPGNIANGPFPLDTYVSQSAKIPDPVHAFYVHQRQINGGKNDRFASEGNQGALTMGYYDGSKMELWKLAQEYTLLDNFFMSAFGGSFLNHQWLICACTPRHPNAPAQLVAVDEKTGVNPAGAEAVVTSDGYAVNTMQSVTLYDPTSKTPRLPPQALPTIGDRLTEKKIPWAYYAEAFNDAVQATKAGKRHSDIAYHHHPFTYYERFINSQQEWNTHLKDKRDFEAAIAGGTLPPVAFYKPSGTNNQHPGRNNLADGDKEAARLVRNILNGPQAKNTLIIITYDEGGGFWDHAPPPKGDRWGPGSRIPAILISPWTKGGRVDHTQYETVSILRLIEERFDLQPVGDRKANSLSRSLRF